MPFSLFENYRSFRDIEWQFPHDTNAIRLLDETLRALREDHGGRLPDEVLGFWLDERSKDVKDQNIFSTPEEKQAMIEIMERWHDIDRLKAKFWALAIRDSRDTVINCNAQAKEDFWLINQLTEERIQLVKQCLTAWLQDRKAGQAY